MRPSDHSSFVEVERHRDRLSKDLRYGAVAGLLGGVSIMILFLGYDALYFEPLATPDFLAEELIGQGAFALDLTHQLRLVRIGIFTVLHLAVFTGLGILLTALFHMTGARESLLLGVLYGLTVCTILFSVVMHLSGTELLADPRWPAEMLGNSIAGVVMVSYLRVRKAL